MLLKANAISHHNHEATGQGKIDLQQAKNNH